MTIPATSRCCSTGSSPWWRPPLDRADRARCWSTRRSAWAATPRRCSSAARGPRDRRRPRPARARAAPARGSRRTASGSHWCTRCTTRSPRCSPTWACRRSTACCSTSASPPCSSTCGSAASPTPRTRRWTCGWTTATGPTAADVLNTYPAADLARILRAYGEERFARRIAGRSSASAARRRSPVGAAGRAGPRRDPGRRPGVPEGTRPSAPSRRCGSRSTTSSACCARALPAADRRASASAAGSW